MVWPRLRLTYQRGSPRVGRRRTTVVNRSESGSPATPTGVRTNRYFHPAPCYPTGNPLKPPPVKSPGRPPCAAPATGASRPWPRPLPGPAALTASRWPAATATGPATASGRKRPYAPPPTCTISTGTSNQQATCGALEGLLPGEGDRSYFSDTSEQAIALVAASIGIPDQPVEVACLERAMAQGLVSELR